MSRPGTADDNLFPPVEKPKEKRGRQEDGTYVTSTGEVLPAKERDEREPYVEPDEAKEPGHEELVESPDGDISFLAVRLSEEEFKKNFLERKRQKCVYKLAEVYAGQPRNQYSYDELEQIRKGELKK